MSILKLPNAGDSATLEITGCAEVEGQYGQQIAFTAGNDVLYLPKESADRQLERIGLGFMDYTEIVGYILTFSRTPSTKPGAKPFWNILKAGSTNAKSTEAERSSAPSQSAPGTQQGMTAPAPAAEPGTEPPEKPKLTQLYLDATTFVLERIVPKFEEREIGLSDTAVVAAIATLFIAASKER